MKIAVTGATGYIGETLLLEVEKRGFTPLAMSRRKPGNTFEWLFYDLDQQNIVLPDDISCVVHLAMNFNLTSELDTKREIESAIRLINATEIVNAKFIYLSSQTAVENASTAYGRAKWEIEKVVTKYSGTIIRPGLVYGGRQSGLFSQLTSFVAKSPLIPNFIPAPKIQPVHVNDLCKAILSIIELPNNTKVFCIASETLVKFDVFLKLLSVYKLRVSRIRIPIPRFLIDVGYKIFPDNPSLIRLNSLFNLPTMETTKDLASIGLKLRPVSSGLHSSGSSRRRGLILEGYAFFSYLFRKKPDLFMVRRYVKFVELLRDGNGLGFRRIVCQLPFLVSFLDGNVKLKNKIWYDEFIYRLNAATALAEASTLGADRFLGPTKPRSILYAILLCTRAISLEVLIRFLSFFVRSSFESFFIKKANSYEA